MDGQQSEGCGVLRLGVLLIATLANVPRPSRLEKPLFFSCGHSRGERRFIFVNCFVKRPHILAQADISPDETIAEPLLVQLQDLLALLFAGALDDLPT